jgi:hypothetical protein
VLKFIPSVIEFDELIKPCIDVSCVISSWQACERGIDAQKKLLDAAIAAGVPRFIHQTIH